MKKLSVRYWKWLRFRARKSLRRKKLSIKAESGSRARIIRGAHHVTAWLGDVEEEVVSRRAPAVPPAELCVHSNPAETLSLLGRLRNSLQLKNALNYPERYLWLRNAKTPRGLRSIPSYIDFSVIKRMSPAAALVVTAEYHRAAEIIGSAPPAIDLHRWGNGAFIPLFRLGFFEAIGHLEYGGEALNQYDEIKYLKAVSGKNGADLPRISLSLMELAGFLENGEPDRTTRVELNNAIGEAIVNVARWAYPDDHQFDFPHLSNFWVTGAADRRNNSFTVVIYDQGITIPVSYPRKALKQAAMDYLKSLLSVDTKFAFQDDSAYIDCAMKFGNSQSDQVHRGQGLPQMRELIDVVQGGALTICSRGGLWHYEYGKPIVRSSYPDSVGGTLIEWKLFLPERQEHA